MREKFVSLILTLAMCFTSITGVNAATLSENLKEEKDISKIKINKEINKTFDNGSKNKKIKIDQYYDSTDSYPL